MYQISILYLLLPTLVFGFLYLPFSVFVFTEESGGYHTKRSTLVKVRDVITSWIQSMLSHSIYMINFNIALIVASRSEVISLFQVFQLNVCYVLRIWEVLAVVMIPLTHSLWQVLGLTNNSFSVWIYFRNVTPIIGEELLYTEASHCTSRDGDITVHSHMLLLKPSSNALVID